MEVPYLVEDAVKEGKILICQKLLELGEKPLKVDRLVDAPLTFGPLRNAFLRSNKPIRNFSSFLCFGGAIL